MIGGEAIGLHFPFACRMIKVNEDILFPATQYVPGLMKEGKPELVIGLIAKAELELGLFRGQPLSRPTYGGVLNLRDQHHSNSSVCAEPLHFRLKNLWLFYRDGSYLVENGAES